MSALPRKRTYTWPSRQCVSATQQSAAVCSLAQRASSFLSLNTRGLCEFRHLVVLTKKCWLCVRPIPTAAQAASPIGQNTALYAFPMLTLVGTSKADNRDSFAVFDGEDCVGHIMRTHKSPPGNPWFWTIFVSDRHNITVDCGYAATREQALADFEALWLRLRRSLEKDRAPGSIRPGLFTQTPHQKSTQPN